jgi:hypothetical protein
MKSVWSMLIVTAVLCAFVAGLRAEGQPVTLTGEILCAKCALQETKKCTTAIKVQENGKSVTYYFKDKGAKEEYHEAVCGGDRRQGTVTGVVTEQDGKKWITPSKVEYAKK